ncbi:DinB family protein [Cochleicola gelatinilyticus]|uniref:DinB family protein n=1 Tax=Cochleicola gelatinilyticus TaxID=1763537 RepID=A0A167IZL5_9FLAO|nr:DinB family protein [Cochleicola gelatinilyticus]OAB80169.1 DinB family protein [Cochleicola gelatinilyticus]
MKTIFLYCMVLFFGISYAQQSTPKEAFLEKWENSKTYLLEIVEAMPESEYDFKPSERQMTFREQLLHIKGNMDWLRTTYFTQSDVKATEAGGTTKKEIIALVTNAFNSVSKEIETTSEETLLETVDFFAGPKSKLQILNLLQDHVTHHRGQLIVYLNLNDIEPPKYSGW